MNVAKITVRQLRLWAAPQVESVERDGDIILIHLKRGSGPLVRHINSVIAYRDGDGGFVISSEMVDFIVGSGEVVTSDHADEGFVAISTGDDDAVIQVRTTDLNICLDIRDEADVGKKFMSGKASSREDEEGEEEGDDFSADDEDDFSADEDEGEEEDDGDEEEEEDDGDEEEEEEEEEEDGAEEFSLDDDEEEERPRRSTKGKIKKPVRRVAASKKPVRRVAASKKPVRREAPARRKPARRRTREF